MKVAILFACLVAVAMGEGDPRLLSISQCESDNRRNCTQNQICVERRMGSSAFHACIDRILMDQTCMRPDTVEMPEARNPVRRSDDGIFDRDVASSIEGRMVIACDANLQCRNMTCQDGANTRCTMRKASNPQVSCDEDGMFDVRQCRRLANETSMSIRPSAAICSCANRMTGAMSDERIVKTRADLPTCGQSCSVTHNRRRVTLRHGESISQPQDQNRQCASCQCNDGMLQCRRAPGVTCSAGQGQASCKSNNKDIQNGETKMDGACNRCRCSDGVLRCTQLPGCRPNSTNQERDEENEKNTKECEACMDMPRSPVCVRRAGRTFPSRCHAMMCAKVPRDQIVDGPCRDDNACMSDPCSSRESCFRTSTKTQMSSRMDRPEARRQCVDENNLTCTTTRTRNDSMQRTIDSTGDDVAALLSRSTDSSNDRDQDRVVCGSSGETFPSICHMIIESDRSDYQVRNTGPCRNIKTSEMLCGTDGVTYRSMDIMRTQGGNVRMDYSGACINGSGSMNTIRNSCKMARMSDRCPMLKNCTRRVNTSDGCCPVCGSVVMLAMDQNRVDNQANTLPDMDTFMGALMQNRTNGKMAVIPRGATRVCDVSITRPTNVPGNVTEVVFQARNMSKAMECHEHAMNMANMLNMAGDNSNTEPITVPESVIAAATVAPELTAASIPFAASPILMLGLLLVKVFLY